MRVDDTTIEKALAMAEEYPDSVLPATVEALLDLRDARSLLREALGYVDEYTRLANDFGAEDVLRRGHQHLEGGE